MTFDAERARKVDLIMLPSSIDGTNCGNCTYFDKGFCKHPKVKMNVNKRMCCYYWQRPDAPRAEESMLDKNSSRFRAAVKLRDRLGRELGVSRFADCGHEKSGDFSHGNTCASGKSSKSRMSRDEARAHLSKVYDSYKEIDYDDIEKEVSKLSSVPSADLLDIAKELKIPTMGGSRKQTLKDIKTVIERRKSAHDRTQFLNKVKASRFSDCGHDPDGDFSKGNTCSSGNTENKKRRVKRSKRAKELEKELENILFGPAPENMSPEEINDRFKKAKDIHLELKKEMEKVNNAT